MFQANIEYKCSVTIVDYFCLVCYNIIMVWWHTARAYWLNIIPEDGKMMIAPVFYCYTVKVIHIVKVINTIKGLHMHMPE